MGLKARLSSYCTKRANNGVNPVTSRKINTRLARPIRETGLYSNDKFEPSLNDLAVDGTLNTTNQPTNLTWKIIQPTI